MQIVREKMHKFYNEIVGFNEYDEILPNFFDEFNSKTKLRKMFLSLSTSLVDGIYSFSNYEMDTLTKYPLKQVFEYKIKSMLPLSYVKTYQQPKSFNLDVCSTIVINNYLNKESKRVLFHNKKLLPLAKLIAFCYNNNKMQLIFDINLLFHQFVYDKVKRLHKDKRVIDSGDSICIMQHHQSPVKIYTNWKSIDTKNLNIKDELKNAIECIKQSEFKQVYLVYPKASDFKRHIPVKVEELEDRNYDIKVIPYSLRSTLRK